MKLCAGEALRLLEQCKQLAPTLPELYTVQSRILKHAGDPQGAAAAACKAESMDLADRCDCHALSGHSSHCHTSLCYDGRQGTEKPPVLEITAAGRLLRIPT